MLEYNRYFVILALLFLMKSSKFCQFSPESLSLTTKEWNSFKMVLISVVFHSIHFFFFFLVGGSSNNPGDISSVKKKQVSIELLAFCWTNTYFCKLKNNACIMLQAITQHAMMPKWWFNSFMMMIFII